MANTNVEREIQARVDQFVQDLTELIRRAALESVKEALGGGGRAATRDRPAGSGGAKPGRKATSKTGGRKKRTPASLQALTQRLQSEIKSKPGRRIEEIARTMRTTTKELALPAKRLLAKKKVKTSGQKRATKYFPR